MKKKQTIVIVIIILGLISSGMFGLYHIRKESAERLKSIVGQQEVRSVGKLDSVKLLTAEENSIGQKAMLRGMDRGHGPSLNDFSVTVLSAEPGRTRFCFELKDYAIGNVTENGKTYSVGTIGGAWETAEKGKPALPVIRRDFIVAKGRKANLRITNVQEDKVACAPPKPSIGILPRTANIPPVEEDASVYESNGVYPSKAVVADERYVIRGAEGMSVSIHPMRYDFHDGTMLVTRSFEAEITEDDAQAEDYGMRDGEWNFCRLLERRFGNGSLLRGGGMDGVIGTMLFIVPDGWLEQLSDFVAWKEKQGYAVIVAGYPTTTGEQSEALAAYIRGAYEDSLVSHVVLCGDWNDVPPAEVSRYPNNPSTASPTTDTPYSWVDGDDLYADLFISRMSVSTVDELSAVCAKIMTYEQSNDDSWRGKGVFIGSSESGTNGVSAGRTDSSLVEEEQLKLMNGVIANVETFYATEMTVTAHGIGTALNEGCSLVYYVGHGLSNRWTTGLFQNTNAAALQNGAMLPFVASFCCSTANFAYSVKSLGEAFLRNPDGGAVGFLGATAETYWNPPIYAMRQMTLDVLNRYSSSRLTGQGAYACSAVMAGIDYIQTAAASEMAGTSTYFAKEMQLLGDCSALGRLGSGRKGAFSISRLNAEQYNVMVTWEDTGEPVIGAAVCIRTADGASRYAVRSGEDGLATVPSFSGKSYLMVSDAGWGCVEEEVDIAIEIDANNDGMITNAEVLAYLNAMNNSSLTSLDIPSTVTEIGERAFYECTSITTITIPSTVTKIGEQAFYGCSALEVISVDDNNSNYVSVNGVLFSKDMKQLICYPPAKNGTSYDIPDSIIEIKQDAFADNALLENMRISQSVKTIGDNALGGCQALSEIIFDGAIPSFGNMEQFGAMTFSVPSDMGWEAWQAPENITVVFRQPSQEIHLTAGWNWVGFHILPESHKVGDVLGTVGFSANDVIQTDNGMARFNGRSWLPSSFTIEYGKMYQIYVNQSVTLVITGKTSYLRTFHVGAGWNWISNPTEQAFKPTELVHNGGWTGGDRIQTVGSSVNYTGSKWIPSSDFSLEPGKGYQLYTDKEGLLTFGNMEDDETLYVVVDLSGGPNATNYPVRYSSTGPDLSDDTCRTTELWLRKIPKGTFMMGSPENEIGRFDRETQHEVTLTQDYYMGVFECTQRQWELVMGNRPSYFNNIDYYATRPVESVSYDDICGTSSSEWAIWARYAHAVEASSFMGKLQTKTGLTFDLPTEAQWEYACRAGTTTALHSGKNLTHENEDSAAAEVGRYLYNGGSDSLQTCTTANGTARVGSYLPNAWGLYDMLGNVTEWCMDTGGVNYYGTKPITDPVGSTTGSNRAERGGSWNYSANGCRAAYWDFSFNWSPEISGFRVACHPKQELYVVVDLSGGPDAESYPVRYTNTKPDLNDDTCRTTELWLRMIRKGAFIMGSPEDELGRNDNETQHEVTLTQDYCIGVFECTQRQWELVMGSNPSEYKGDCRPLENVSYDSIRGTGYQAGAGWPTYGHAVDSISFMGKLQVKTGLIFDLPTEAQWEYACRAGTMTALNSGKNLTNVSEADAAMNEVGRYKYNYTDGKGGYAQHTKVGSYLPNAWGLYDMHGNVREWCLDWYNRKYYKTSPKEDPAGDTSGTERAARGSGWFNSADYCRSAFRYSYYSSYIYNNCGFRIVCMP